MRGFITSKVLWMRLLSVALMLCALRIASGLTELPYLPWELLRRCDDCHVYFCLINDSCSATWFTLWWGVLAGIATLSFLAYSRPAHRGGVLATILTAACVGAGIISMLPLGRFMGLGVGQLVTVLTVIALVASLSRKTHARSRFQNLKVDPTERTRHATSQFPQGARDWFFLAALFLVFVSIAATASLVVFSGKPFFADTEGMLAQGRLFARGMLKGTSTEFLPGTGFIVHRANEWFSIYSPGHPLMLALGSLFGNKEFLVNPILGGLSATLMVALAYKRYGKAVSCSTALLFCVSPWVVFTSAEFLAHATTLFFITLALYSITSWEDGRKGAWMWALAFACFGLVITRPYTGIALLAPLPFYLYSQGIALRHLMRALFGVASGAAVVLAHNYALTGDAFLSPYELLLGTGHGPGFGDRGPTRGYFDLWTGLEYLFLNLRSISTWLFVWPIPSLSLFVLALLTTRIRALEALYLGCVVSLCAAYTAYWDFKNELLGPRFLYESVGILILFSAIGLVRLIDLANTRYSRIALGVCFVGCVAFSVWMCAFSLAPDFMAR